MMELHTALSVEPAGVLQPPAASLNVPGPANVASDVSGNGPLSQPLGALSGGAGVFPLNPVAEAGRLAAIRKLKGGVRIDSAAAMVPAMPKWSEP